MIRRLTLLLAGLLLSVPLFSQRSNPVKQNSYTVIDQLVEKKNDSLNSLGDIAVFINTSFQKDRDKARAIFYWLTKNIAYSAKLGYVSTDDNYCTVVNTAFQRKTGVCMDYAALFDTLAKLTGLTSHIVEGSTRQTFLTSVIGHAWNAVKLDSAWNLLDATWGSGYLKNQVFVKERNDDYFLTPPEKFIETHLPMDPIWQLLKHPVTLEEFHKEEPAADKTDWNYNDSIAVFLSASPISQVKNTIRRLKAFGIDSEVTANYYIYLKSRETDYYTKQFNAAVQDDNEAVIKYNEFVTFKNKQFTPAKPDEAIAGMMPAVTALLDRSEKVYLQIFNKADNADLNAAIKTNLKQVAELRKRVKTETEFVNKYLGTKKNKRRDLFYTKTYTLYGTRVK